MPKLPIITYPNSILSELSTPVEIINNTLNQEDATLIRNMWDTVLGLGVGLAAPQVGIGKQICIIKLSEDPESGNYGNKGDLVVINPKITFYSEVTNSLVEGCLSFPGQYWEIERPANIKLDYTTIANLKDFLKGASPTLQKRKLTAKRWLSRVLQHEIDHLHGKLYINAGGRFISPETFEGTIY